MLPPNSPPLDATAALRVVVVDDEPPARRKLAQWLAADPAVEVVAVCANGYEALDTLAAEPVDLLFLDVQMPELSGFDVLRQRPAGCHPLVIFATAFDTYALEAFRHHAVGYLLKPYDRRRFNEALDHAKAQHAGRQAHEAEHRLTALLQSVQPPRYLEHFAVRHDDRIDLVRTEEVDWIEASGNYVTLHAGHTRHLIRDTLTRVSARLDPRQFPRIHRSRMVNLDRVVSLLPASHGDFTVVLRDGTMLPMSRTYRDHLREVLEVGF
ncbi:MAG: LytTR family DNA-binding domain-containing protein [Bacteroidota bacterium]